MNGCYSGDSHFEKSFPIAVIDLRELIIFFFFLSCHCVLFLSSASKYRHLLDGMRGLGL